ncbi:MAG: sialate O-acetylesterase [Cryomorphaceae bacterium]|jgi:sialate O-acetylesterase
MQIPKLVACAGLMAAGLFSPLAAQKMPREDVVEVPSIGDGLFLNNLFQSNMVIQRDKPVSLWGWADPGEKVTVMLAGKEETATAGKDRAWKVTFPAMPANSKPINVTIKGKSKTLTLKNILVGDVWVLGGQSNMEFPLHKVEDGNLEIASANFSNIRILTIPSVSGPKPKKGFARLHEWSDWSKRHFRKGDWDVCSPEIAKELSAIGYVFARRIHMTSQVPIGVVDVSVGGTTLETWTPDAVIRKVATTPAKDLMATWDKKIADWDGAKDLEDQIKRHHAWVKNMKKQGRPIPANRKVPTEQRLGPAYDRNRPGSCYAGMIAPLEGFAVKGAIFHQGYNNCFGGTEGAKMYRDVFPKMITAWRAAFNDPEMPFGIMSLCTAGNKQSLENYSEMMGDTGIYVREAQYQTFLEFYKAGDKHIGFTSTYDFRRRWYHPQQKLPAGERVARWALASEYGMEKMYGWKPPMILEMKKGKGSIMLHTDVAARGVDDGGPIEGFAIAGKDRKFHPAKVDFLVTGKDEKGREKKDNKVIVLTSLMVTEPVHYRYAWGRNPMGNMLDKGIPLATQRSDDWPREAAFVDGKLTVLEGRAIGKELRKLDEERAMKEAKYLLDNK